MRLLFVGDNPEELAPVGAELRRLGYAFEHGRVDSLAALRLALESRSWSAVISEYQLPGFTGIDALHAVREHSPDLPFLLVSGDVEFRRSLANSLAETMERAWAGCDRRKLEVKREQADRLASLGRLAGTIAHEFNNVLMGISPFLEILRRGKNVESSLEHIGSAVKRGKRLTQDLLRFTQPAQPVRAAFDATSWIENIAVEARTLLPPQCTVETAIPAGLSVHGDATQLQQIFTDLVLNARDAMAHGGTLTIEMRRETAGARLPFAVEHPERFAHFIVSDTGCGMPDETLRHVFEPLFTTKKNGSGLGLPVAHQVVQRHGGEIFVESTPGAGTAVHIFLPLSEETELHAARPATTAAQRGATPTAPMDDPGARTWSPIPYP